MVPVEGADEATKRKKEKKKKKHKKQKAKDDIKETTRC